MSSIKVAVRADSSLALGSGHVMRCLTLAQMLRSFGAEIHFICLNLAGHLAEYLEREGFIVHLIDSNFKEEGLSTEQLIDKIKNNTEYDVERTRRFLSEYGPFDWIILDHYSFGEKWELQIYPYTSRILVIDDLANRIHNCDVLLDQNYYYDTHARYEGKVPARCIRLLGPKYVLFRSEFTKIKKTRTRDGNIRRMFVFFGGSDLTNETAKTLKALGLLNRKDLQIDVVIGASNPHEQEIKQLCSQLVGATFYKQINHMAALMNEADLAIGAGGATTWERCLLGLPALVILLAENQKSGIQQVQQEQAVINLGEYESVDIMLIYKQLVELMTQPERVKMMAKRAAELVPYDHLFKAEDWRRLFFE